MLYKCFAKVTNHITVNVLPLSNINRVGFERSDQLVENPQRPHEGGEDASKGCGLLHQHVHAGVVHVPADGPGGGLEGLQVGVSHVLHLGNQPACLTRGRRAQGDVPCDRACKTQNQTSWIKETETFDAHRSCQSCGRSG